MKQWLKAHALALAASSTLCLGQQPPEFQAHPCTQRRVIASALTKDGRFVGGLRPEHFQIEPKGFAVVERAEFAARTPRIVLLLDTSGSMSQPPEKWGLAIEAAKALLSAAPAQSPVALIRFADKVVPVAGFDTPRQVISEELNRAADRRELKGRTALRDAIWEALNMLGAGASGDAIVAVTDGGDNRSRRVKNTELEQGLAARGVRLYAFLLVSRAVVPEELTGPSGLVEIAVRSGGYTAAQHSRGGLGYDQFDVSAPALEKLRNAAQFILWPMSNYYVLHIRLQQELKKPKKWKLELAKAPQLKNIRLSHSQWLMPCGSGTNAP